MGKGMREADDFVTPLRNARNKFPTKKVSKTNISKDVVIVEKLPEERVDRDIFSQYRGRTDYLGSKQIDDDEQKIAI